MDLRDYTRAFFSRWVIVLVMALAGSGCALAVSAAMPQVYEARATLFVKVETGSGSAYERSQFSLQRVKSYPSLVKSPEVLQPVIRQLGLDLGPDELGDRVSADNPLDTIFLNVTAQSPYPRTAADIANAVAISLGRHIRQLETTAGDSRVTVNPKLTVPAEQPVAPASPRTPLNVALGALIGLSAGLLFAITAYRLDTRLRTGGDVQSAVGVPVVGQLPRYRGRGGKPAEWSRDSEHWVAHRELLTNILLAGQARLPSLMLLVPASPGAGGGFQRKNFALMVADMGRRICVLETDAMLPPAFGDEGPGPGLSEVLAGQTILSSVIRSAEPAGLVSYVPAGSQEAEGGRGVDLAQQVVPVVDELKARFDITLTETTGTSRPLDAQQLVPHAEYTVVVCQYAKTRRDDLRRTFAELAAAGSPPQAVVMTGVPYRRRPSAVMGFEQAEAATGRHAVVRGADING